MIAVYDWYVLDIKWMIFALYFVEILFFFTLKIAPYAVLPLLVMALNLNIWYVECEFGGNVYEINNFFCRSLIYYLWEKKT